MQNSPNSSTNTTTTVESKLRSSLRRPLDQLVPTSVLKTTHFIDQRRYTLLHRAAITYHLSQECADTRAGLEEVEAKDMYVSSRKERAQRRQRLRREYTSLQYSVTDPDPPHLTCARTRSSSISRIIVAPTYQVHDYYRTARGPTAPSIPSTSTPSHPSHPPRISKTTRPNSPQQPRP